MKRLFEKLYPVARYAGATVLGASLMAGCSGCMSLQNEIPKAVIEFSNPATGQKVAITSHKDVELTGVRVTFDTNGCPTISIEHYAAKSNIEVVKAAIQAQQQQIAGVQQGLAAVVNAAVSGATPGK